MANDIDAGCEIHAYDHTIPDYQLKRFQKPDQGLFIHKKGIAIETKPDFTTLPEELEKFGHSHAQITYLKVGFFTFSAQFNKISFF